MINLLYKNGVEWPYGKKNDRFFRYKLDERSLNHTVYKMH